MAAKDWRHPGRMFLLAPNANERIVETANKTPLSRKAGVLHMYCDFCSIPITKPAAWAKKYAKHYCGVACRSADTQINIKRACRVCGKEYAGQRSRALKSATCGADECVRAIREIALKEMIKAAAIKNRGSGRPVKATFADGTVKEYSTRKMAEMDGFNVAKICLCVSGKRKTHGGAVWSNLTE